MVSWEAPEGLSDLSALLVNFKCMTALPRKPQVQKVSIESRDD